MKRSLLIDWIVFMVLIGITALFPWVTEGTWWSNAVIWSLVTIIPITLYLGIRKKKNWKKIVVGTIVFGGLLGVILEYFAHITLAWQVPTTLFPFRILGTSTIDALIGYIPMTLLVFVFYEHFFDRDVTHKVSSKIWHAVIPTLCAMVVITILHFTRPSALLFSDAYLKIGLAAIVPLIWQVIRFPRLLPKYAMLSVSLFLIFFIFELVGVTYNFWIFPGTEYIGMVNAFGRTFPLEEIIFWMLLYPPTIAAYYEHFIDDEK